MRIRADEHRCSGDMVNGGHSGVPDYDGDGSTRTSFAPEEKRKKWSSDSCREPI